MPVKHDVASILERETQVTIDNWYLRVEQEKELIPIPLTRDKRCAHLPEMFSGLVARLREPLDLGTRALSSDGAYDHGLLRRDQGYTAAMMVEESRMLQISIFETIQMHFDDTSPWTLMLDVMTIADELESQLAQAMASYIGEANMEDTKAARLEQAQLIEDAGEGATAAGELVADGADAAAG